MHLINQFIMQLPVIKKSRYAHIILVVSQLTYPMFLKKRLCKHLLTSHANLNPPTLLNPTITKYNTPLHIVLEDPYKQDTRLT
jgi:hypothetical protein